MSRKILVLAFTLIIVATGIAACSGRSSEATGEEAVLPAAPPTAETAPISPTAEAEQASPADPAAEAPQEAAPPLTQPATDAPEQAASPVADVSTLNIGLEPVAQGLQSPVGIASAGDGSGRLFVVEKAGTIRIVQDGAVLPAPFLDITGRVRSSGSEQGLLGLAFHPDFAQNGFFFVNYSDRQGNTVVARFSVSSDPNRADPASEARVLWVEQPAGNHNGGHLAFGPDGYLYIGLGDGGGGGDTYGHGQNTRTLLGAMLRVDVGELPYTIPPDNPFVGNPDVLDEIWAYGLRNPWRYAFDRETGDLYIADVGQNAYEEVSFQPANSAGGENYGWPIMEGLHCYPETQSCDSTGLVLPVAEYAHGAGECSVTGGNVYRGQVFPALRGAYFYGDYCSGRMWGLARGPDGAWQSAALLQQPVAIAGFGEDDAGEVYVADMRNGVIYRLVAR